MNSEQLQEFVRLTNVKADLNTNLKSIELRLSELEATLIPQFIADRMHSASVDGRTIYLRPDVYASVREGQHDMAVEELKTNGLAEYVQETFSIQAIKAWVREIAADVRDICKRDGIPYDEAAIQRALPGNLGQALKISFVYKLGNTKSSK